MSRGIKITSDRIGTELIDIHVDSSGSFTADFNGDSFDAKTREELIVKLTKAVKAAANEKAIPLSLVDVRPKGKNDYYSDGPLVAGRGVAQVKLRGKHGRESSAFLFLMEDGTKFKLSSYRHQGTPVRRLNAAQIAEYERLTAAIDVAQAAYDEWLKEYTVSLDAVLRDPDLAEEREYES